MNKNAGPLHINQKIKENCFHKFLSSSSCLVLALSSTTFCQASDFYDRDFIEMDVPTIKSQAFVIKDSENLINHISLFAPQFQKAPGRGDIRLIPDLQDDAKAQLRFEFVMRTIASELNGPFFDFLPFAEDTAEDTVKNTSSDNTSSKSPVHATSENLEKTGNVSQTNRAQPHKVPESNPETRVIQETSDFSPQNQFETTVQNTPTVEKVSPAVDVNNDDEKANHHTIAKNKLKQVEINQEKENFTFASLLTQNLNPFLRNNMVSNPVTHFFDKASLQLSDVNRGIHQSALKNVSTSHMAFSNESFVTLSDVTNILLSDGMQRSHQNAIPMNMKTFTGNVSRSSQGNAVIMKISHHLKHFSTHSPFITSQKGLANINMSNVEKNNGFAGQNYINNAKIMFALRGVTNHHVISFMATLMSLPILTKLAGNMPSHNVPIRLPVMPQNISYSLRMLLRRRRFLSILEV